MNCLDFRRFRLSDPYSTDAESLSHRAECEACRGFENEVRNLDKQIKKALTVEVPEGLAARILLDQSLQSKPRKPTRWYWLSMAASFFVAVGIVVVTMVPAPMEKVLVQHLEWEEPIVQSMMMPVQQPQIRQVLNSINLDSTAAWENVVFASTCIINGELVAHLVVEDADHKFTLVLLPQKLIDIDAVLEFDDERWRGVISPHQSGSSMAVVASAKDPASFDSMHALIKRLRSSVKPLKV
jgi:hypothetical protein|tara:strand:+ start:1873 stop:2592 length:720 start_codon:yes stop_codon:yes gene_type:complete